jgi:DNA-binding NtrC family response regulator
MQDFPLHPSIGDPPARKRILVMDDDASILELTGRMLKASGYEVDLTNDGNIAVAQYHAAKESGRPYDVVILDLTVPAGMGGYDAFKAMQAFDPAVKAIVSSGYSHEPVVLNYRSFGLAGVAPKPYKIKELVGAVESVLRS